MSAGKRRIHTRLPGTVDEGTALECTGEEPGITIGSIDVDLASEVGTLVVASEVNATEDAPEQHQNHS